MRAHTIAMLGAAAAAGFAVAFAASDALGGLERACVDDANVASCLRLADAIERDDSARRYPEEPGHYLALACAAGSTRACERAQPYARLYGDYEVFELDATCMVKRSAFACEEVAGSLRGEASELAGAATATLPLARARMRRAESLYVEACRAGDGDSCFGASRVYAAAFGVAWNLRASREYAARACDLGQAAACEQEGDRSTGDDALARYTRACALTPGSPHAWLKLARTQEATGAARDVTLASYRRACELLAFDACRELAQSRTDLANEPPGVVGAFARWCESGDARACALVKARLAL